MQVQYLRSLTGSSYSILRSAMHVSIQAGSAALNSAAATGVVVAASKMSAAPQELLPFNLHLPAA